MDAQFAQAETNPQDKCVSIEELPALGCTRLVTRNGDEVDVTRRSDSYFNVVPVDGGCCYWGLTKVQLDDLLKANRVVHGIRGNEEEPGLVIDANDTLETLQAKEKAARIVRRARILQKARHTTAACRASSCWEASGEKCSCSCGGENHSIAYDPDRVLEYHRLLGER